MNVLCRVALLDPALPRPNRFRETVAVARAGDKREEKVGVLEVKRAQPLGDNPRGRTRRGDGRLDGCGVELIDSVDASATSHLFRSSASSPAVS